MTCPKPFKVSIWENCYADNWNGLIVPEAFSHPAKFAPGLIRRIYEHCLAQGYLRKGDTVVDPFGGIGSGGIFAAPMGLAWLGCELEKKFVDLAWQNFELHRQAWLTMGYPLSAILTGDSRRLSEIIGQADCAVMSPPYAGTELRGGPTKNGQGYTAAKRCFNDYGQSPGQIGSMKAGNLAAVVTSPPYAESLQSQDHGIDFAKIKPDYPGRKMHEKRCAMLDRHAKERRYSPDPSNIGNLKAGDVGAVVTSPPWESSDPRTQGTSAMDEKRRAGITPPHDSSGRGSTIYGNSNSQIANEIGPTYWQAVSDVYRECHKILKPGGVLVCVVKSYVKAGRKVPLPQQTLKLLIHLGFEPLERIKAMLVKEEIHQGLFGEMRKVKERKSFFRRLAEKKGSPRIDFEEVLIVGKATE